MPLDCAEAISGSEAVDAAALVFFGAVEAAAGAGVAVAVEAGAEAAGAGSGEGAADFLLAFLLVAAGASAAAP